MTVLLALVGWLGAAQAQEEACAGELPLAFWSDAMDAVDDSIAEFNGERATRILDDILYELRCLRDPAPPALVGRMARQISLLAFYEQDAAEAEAWALLARETVGGAPWPEGVPVPPAYHAFVAELPEAELRVVEGQGIAPPKKGAVLLDGWLLTEPAATLGTTHLLQVADKKGGVQLTTWQHGATFPDSVLGPPAEVRAPKWYTEPAEPPPMPEPVGEAPEEAGEALVDAAEVVEDAVEVVVDAPDEVADVVDPGTRVARRLPSKAEREKMFSKDLQDGCPWKKQPKNVTAKGGEVQINRHSYPVRAAADQRAFKQVLRQCGEFRAARRFDRWRDARRHLSLQAGTYKARMIKALLTEEPERRKGRKRGGAGRND